MTLTEFLAVWGAIFSSGAIAWNVIRDLRDRADLQLSVMIGHLSRHPTTGQMMFMRATRREEATHFIVQVTNHGRRAALVTKLFLRWPNDPSVGLILPRTLPKPLRENDFAIEYTEIEGPVDPGIERVFAVDSTGKEWDLSKKQLQQLRDDVKSLGLLAG